MKSSGNADEDFYYGTEESDESRVVHKILIRGLQALAGLFIFVVAGLVISGTQCISVYLSDSTLARLGGQETVSPSFAIDCTLGGFGDPAIVFTSALAAGLFLFGIKYLLIS